MPSVRRPACSTLSPSSDEDVRPVDRLARAGHDVVGLVGVDRREHLLAAGLHVGEEAQQRPAVVALREALAAQQAARLQHRVGQQEAVGGHQVDARASRARRRAGVCSSRAVVLLPTATLPATAMTNGHLRRACRRGTRSARPTAGGWRRRAGRAARPAAGRRWRPRRGRSGRRGWPARAAPPRPAAAASPRRAPATSRGRTPRRARSELRVPDRHGAHRAVRAAAAARRVTRPGGPARRAGRGALRRRGRASRVLACADPSGAARLHRALLRRRAAAGRPDRDRSAPSTCRSATRPGRTRPGRGPGAGPVTADDVRAAVALQEARRPARRRSSGCPSARPETAAGGPRRRARRSRSCRCWWPSTRSSCCCRPASGSTSSAPTIRELPRYQRVAATAFAHPGGAGRRRARRRRDTSAEARGPRRPRCASGSRPAAP